MANPVLMLTILLQMQIINIEILMLMVLLVVLLMLLVMQVYNLIPPSPAVATFIQSLAPLNSAANPLIYCLFSANIGQI